MIVGLIGSNGFIGSAISRQLNLRGVPTINIFKHTDLASIGPIDVLIDANGNSRKYIADTDPLLDFDLTVKPVLSRLVNIKPKTYVYLSSGEVYGEVQNLDTTIEDRLSASTQRSNYGMHKYLSELLVQQYSNRYFLIRLGGFVGAGLKKNPVFDIFNSQPLRVSPKSKFQFMDVDYAATLLLDLIERASPGAYNLSSVGTIALSEVCTIGKKPLLDRCELHRMEYHELSVQKIQNTLGIEVPSTTEFVTRFANTYPG